MRIQNNITAMNTHRMYTINNDNVAKSAEKLSSGYRINRAGDDAAGLAISEKMRAQIRGLNMATKNSQDAISLVQTAEGALQETHSMLQRMNELAVQAATGTNEGFDRTQAAKEFEQLKREINDVAEQTNFNNMKILDGSLSYEGYVRSAQTAGVSSTVETETTNAVDPSSVKVQQEAVDGRNAQAGEFIITSTTADMTAGKSYVLDIKIGGESIKNSDITSTGAGLTSFTFDAATSKTSLGTALAGLKFTYKGVEFTGAADNTNNLKFTTAATPGSDIDLKELGIEVTLTEVEGDVPGTSSSSKPLAVAASSIKNAETAITAQKQKNEITLDMSKVAYGDTFSIGDKKFKVMAADDKSLTATEQADLKDATKGFVALSDGTIAVAWNGENEYSNLVQNLVKATATGAAGEPTDVTVAAVAGSTNKFTVTDATTAETPDQTIEDKYKVAFKYDTGADATKGMKTTLEFDVAKMKDGDKFTINADDEKIEVTFNGESRKDFMSKVEQAVKDAGATGYAKVKGNALIVSEKKVTTDLAWNESLNDKTNALRIQVGANENEQLALSIDSMNTKGLGLDDAFLTIAGQSTDENIDSAGAAITAVKDAINKVSDQRATLGAMQNRLDHKIANLKVTSENLSAAESRIRDVDMASEMTNFTKNNILSQAATAMLAQANALPQNVLSLLG